MDVRQPVGRKQTMGPRCRLRLPPVNSDNGHAPRPGLILQMRRASARVHFEKAGVDFCGANFQLSARWLHGTSICRAQSLRCSLTKMNRQNPTVPRDTTSQLRWGIPSIRCCIGRRAVLRGSKRPRTELRCDCLHRSVDRAAICPLSAADSKLDSCNLLECEQSTQLGRG